ncbi:MAG TPA: 3-ketoacyl-ACP reductase [Armatimonadetes bacterium]|nr:3-ketoacyl-ACP reductase [Armatimonadota bacterium]
MSQQAATRVALVTGGSRGIGRGIATALGAAGWAVGVNYHSRADAAEEVAAAIRAAGGQAVCLQGDIGDLDCHAALLAGVQEAFGPLDLLVNNAGIGTQVRGDLLEATPESFDVVLATNLRGPYFLTQRVARAMVERTAADPAARPKIVTVSSMSAYTASTSRGDYCLSKAALAMLTALFADRLAPHGINVYEIRPGIIATDMTGPVREKYDALIADGLTPIRRWGQPDDIARAVLAIASEMLPFSTGQVIDVDGGFHLRRL